MKLPDLSDTAVFKLSNQATTCFASQNCPNTLFFGMMIPGQFGQAVAGIQIVLPGREVAEANAHTAAITAFEYAKIGGQEVLFSASADCHVRAWDVTNAQQPAFTKMNKILERNFQMPVLSLKMTSPSFLVIGMNDGTFTGWDLNSNNVNSLQAHS